MVDLPSKQIRNLIDNKPKYLIRLPIFSSLATSPTFSASLLDVFCEQASSRQRNHRQQRRHQSPVAQRQAWRKWQAWISRSFSCLSASLAKSTSPIHLSCMSHLAMAQQNSRIDALLTSCRLDGIVQRRRSRD